MKKIKKTRKYVTLSHDEGMAFREIADRMTTDGDRMNHSTARGVLLLGMTKVATALLRKLRGKAEPGEVQRLIRDVNFQRYVGIRLNEHASVRKRHDSQT